MTTSTHTMNDWKFYFTNNKSIEENLLKLKDITFINNNTVGPKSISKQELIEEFIKVL
jgi:hypothetical protein